MRFPILFTIFVWSLGAAAGAELSIPGQIVSPGQSVVTAVSFLGHGQTISALQFDLVWNSPLDLRVGTGSVVGLSSKNLYMQQITPGTLRCVIAGYNLNPLADGEVLRLFLTIPANASPGTARISTTNAAAAAPDGTSVPLAAAASDIQISGTPSDQLLQTAGVVNAASLLPGPIAPGEMITLFGLIPEGKPAVLINGTPAPVTYSDARQVNAIVPFQIDTSAPAALELKGSTQSARITVPTAAVAPGIFTLTGSGVGPGAVLNEDFGINTYAAPARPDSVIMIYATGLGLLASPVTDGSAVASALDTTLPVTVQIGGEPAAVLYAGSAPGLVAGVMQINVRIPKDLPPNPETPIALTAGGVSVLQGATVAIQ